MTTRRDGFTIIELLLVLLLGSLLLGGVYDTMTRQEKAYGTFNARAGTQQDTRIGMDLLSAELRELNVAGDTAGDNGDLLMATPDSIRIRAMRKFGIVCHTDQPGQRFIVATEGATTFSANDSILVYVDRDSLRASDDTWRRSKLTGVSASLGCGLSAFGLAQALLSPDATRQQLQVTGGSLPLAQIYPGAPIRSFETLTYRVAGVGSRPWVVRVQADTIMPLFGPVAADGGFRLAYFDTAGTELTTFPLSLADRRSVGRIRLELRARRQTNADTPAYTDSLISEIFVRGN